MRERHELAHVGKQLLRRTHELREVHRLLQRAVDAHLHAKVCRVGHLLRVEVRINGELKQSIDFSQLVRPAQQLQADVGEFITIAHGDVLMLGCDAGRPLARPGDRIEISAPGFETLVNTLVKEQA